jgi:hypothetical protein
MRTSGRWLALLALTLAPQAARAHQASASAQPANTASAAPAPRLTQAANAAPVQQKPVQAVTVRTLNRGSFGRVVFKVTKGQADSEDRQGDRLSVHLPGAGTVPGALLGATNIVSVVGGPDGAVLNLAPGSVTRVWRQAGLLGIDAFDARLPRGVSSAAAPATRATREPGPAGLLADQRSAWSAGPTAVIETISHVAAPAKAPAPVLPAPVLPAAHVAASGRAAASDRGPLQFDLVPLESPPVAAAAEKPPPLAAAAAPPAGPVPVVPTAGTPAEAGDALAAVRLASDPMTHEDAILLPFDAEVGAAAFALGDTGHVVFDDAKPVDLAALKDDRVFGRAGVKLLPAGTHFQLKLAPGTRLRLHRRPDGWVVAVAPAGGLEDTAEIAEKDGVINIGEHGATDTVVMDDPATGAHLLIGTVLTPGPPVAVKHVSAEFTLLPSWTGVVVAPLSDRIVLRAEKAGFQLRTATGPALAAVFGGAAEQAVAEAGTLTRHFAFLSLPTETLVARLDSELSAAAAAPRLARLRPRLRAAQDMLALGLDREAAGLLRVAIEDDPRGVNDADAQALLTMADWLGGEPGDDGGRPSLSGSDEAALWQAVMHPSAPNPTAAAATLAADWRLLLAYPAPLRRRLVPAVVATMLAGGETRAAASLLTKIDDPALDDARAEVLERDGKRGDALALLDRVAGGPDRKRAAAAARHAVELRLAGGQLTPAQAAEALEKRLYAWRDDAIELALRLRVAALRSQAGAPRPALSLLRETETLFPDAHDQVRAAEHQVLASMLRSGAGRGLSPLDMVALVAENEDLLTDQDASNTLAPVLVDKLLALDLPDRAAPLLQRLMAGSTDGEARAGLGARLADLRLDQGDAPGAVAALDGSAPAAAAAALSAPLAARRTVLRARALAAAGEGEAAVRLLAPETGTEALDLRAQLCEQRHDWLGADQALRALAHAMLPPAGALTDAQQDLVLRLASAASQAGDMAVLQELRVGAGLRLAPGPRLELFRALTAQPVQSLGDLARSAHETEAARALPSVLTSYPAH